MKIFTSLLFSILLSAGIMAQNQISSTAVQHLSASYEQLGLEASDIENVIVDHAYTDDKGISFIYLVQTHKGIPVYNAIMTIAIGKNGKVLTTGNRFISDLKSKVVSTEAKISEVEAIQIVAKHFKTETSVAVLRSDSQKGITYFTASELANSEIPVTFKYEADADGKLHKVYDLSVDMKENSDWWSIRVDAATGKILSKNNWTVYCNHNHSQASAVDHSCKNDFIEHTTQRQSAVVNDGASYRVYPFPAESPLETEQVLIVDPADDLASPLGWHDTDGMDGAEFTITRGNNVHAYLDTDNNNSSPGTEPDGGEDLVFDFEHNQSNEPTTNLRSAQVNLFYANNFLHDFSYKLGFDEAAGNFQVNNYSGEGNADDQVNAEALDGDGTNNARFGTPPDGGNGRMEMFLWDNPSGAFSIDSPQEIAGLIGEVGTANFGPPVDTNPISGTVVVANDGTQFSAQGCNSLINSSDITGNIAIIDRGSCDFILKTRNAQEAGALAVIICNISGVNGGTGEELLTLGAPDGAEPVDIPALMLKKSDCDRIKASISANIDVSVTFQLQEPNGPDQLDASYDNGVIAHEFGHGIHNRLTGGPSNTGCYPTFDDDENGTADRGEQMGEGYADFMALITTLKAGDNGADAKPIGRYVDASNAGIRNFPYSNDMNVNPMTYNDIITINIPHGVGELMAVLGWDLLWRLVEDYGLDATWTDTNSGNYIAARLVFDGMKLQPCRPGYVDVRDAILFADELNNEGANVCAIWEVFSRRGLGINADQGSPLDQRDGSEDFTSLATCIEKLKVNRTIAELVQPGATLTVDVEAINHIPGDAVAGIITEKLQEGLTYVEGSAPYPATILGNEVTFDVGMLEYDTPINFSYEVSSTVDIKSTSLNIENLEDGGSNFEFFDLEDAFNFFFETDQGRNGTTALTGAAPETEVDFGIITPAYEIPTDVEVPALRFWHRYDLETGADAVFLSISTDDGNTWEYVTDFLKNGYSADIQYGTFAIPALRAFSGSTNGEFIDSYVDLSAFKGETIKIRFRLGTDDNTTVDNAGWTVDDIELMDLTQYEVETCIGTIQDPEIECNESTTIIVDTNLDTNTEDNNSDIYAMTVYPNPAKTKIYLDVASPSTQAVQVKLTSLDGRLIKNTIVQVSNTTQTIGFNIVDLDSGMYLIQVQSDQGLSTRKFVKN